MMYKFTGAGNDFVVMDGRKGGMDGYRRPERIGQLCREHKTDGLMILGTAPDVDFSMEFYNPDGSGGMMCGNGGRCIVAFANYLGICPAHGTVYRFLAPDGLHTAEILEGPEREGISQPSLRDPSHLRWASPFYAAEGGHRLGNTLPLWTVRLKMIDVQGITPIKDGCFLNTGTRHFVQFKEQVQGIDMDAAAKPLRWDAAFQPEGTNVNFVESAPDGLHVRTYEKGVEGETLACGTGLTASAIAAWQEGIPGEAIGQGSVRYRLQCRRGDWLQVEFTPEDGRFKDVYLTGPAEMLYAFPKK